MAIPPASVSKLTARLVANNSVFRNNLVSPRNWLFRCCLAIAGRFQGPIATCMKFIFVQTDLNPIDNYIPTGLTQIQVMC